MTPMRRSIANAAVFAAPAVFVLLWASGFIGAKLGLPYAEPMTFLTVRMTAVVLVLGLIGMTIGTLYQKRFGGGIEWRTGFLIQYVAAAALFALSALATETLKVQ